MQKYNSLILFRVTRVDNQNGYGLDSRPRSINNKLTFVAPLVGPGGNFNIRIFFASRY